MSDNEVIMTTIESHETDSVVVSSDTTIAVSNDAPPPHGSSSNSSSSERFLATLLFPVTIEYIDFKGLVHLNEINREIKAFIAKSHEDVGYWRSICSSYCFYAGVYSSMLNEFRHINYKKHFFDDLWCVRMKWDSTTRQPTASAVPQSYKIKVGIRFRPGVIQSDKVCLPLHQFLKVKRHQLAEKQKKATTAAAATADSSSSQENGLLIGENDPEEYVDPFLGTLMKDPVLLTSSNRIVDRSVAVQCILRGGKDPFNSSKLSMSMLIPQPQLLEQIQAFREKKAQWDVTLQTSELKPLLDDATVHSELLEALLEVEQINLAMQRAEKDAMTSKSKSSNHHHFPEDQETTETDDNIPESTMTNDDDTNTSPFVVANPNDDSSSWMNYGVQSIADSQDNMMSSSSSFVTKKIETAGIVEINDKTACVAMHIPGAGVKPFHYSSVFKGEASQKHVYEKSAQDAIVSILNGFNAAIMCYGQTGSGKTYTFFGPDESMFASAQSSPTSGVVIRTFQELIAAREFLGRNGINMSFTAQLVEIYEESVTDLLTGQIVNIRKDSGEISNAKEASALETMEDVLNILRLAHERKRFAATAMNERSSRSHTAVIVHVIQKINHEKMLRFKLYGSSGLCDALMGSVVNDDDGSSTNDKLIKSQLHLIDLAGSERIKKSKASGLRLREAVGINSSLLVLGKVISALVKGQSHIPYFESKLTTMLKAAFGGNSRTTVLINCRSDGDSGDETLQSMRFGERCGMITNSMIQTATSFKSAIVAIEEAVTTVRTQLDSLQARNKQHLPSYKALLQSYQELERKRKELVRVEGGPIE